MHKDIYINTFCLYVICTTIQNMTIYFVCLATGPLNVFFKLPVTEISEIDDRKSVSTFLLTIYRLPQNLNFSRKICFSFFNNTDHFDIFKTLFRQSIIIVKRALFLKSCPLSYLKCYSFYHERDMLFSSYITQ